MPRKNGGASSHRPSAPSRRASTQAVPQQMSTPQQHTPQQRQPGFLSRVAATAGGVAVGSAVGHTVGHMITGGSNNGRYNDGQQDINYPEQQQQSSGLARYVMGLGLLGASGAGLYYRQQMLRSVRPSMSPVGLAWASGGACLHNFFLRYILLTFMMVASGILGLYTLIK